MREQLDSFKWQTYGNWHIHASDDGSSDDTLSILRAHQARWGKDRITIHEGSRRGGAANFLTLSLHSNIQADVYFFADQDDIWHQDKISRAITALPMHEKPGLYMSSTLLVDAENNLLGPSKVFHGQPSFPNALVQNMAAGNTMAFNAAFAQQLRKVGRVDVPYHDWWCYLLATAIDALIIYDPVPTLRYRQHQHNVLGENRTFKAIAKRLSKVLRDDFKIYNDKNLAALQQAFTLLNDEKMTLLQQFSTMRHGSFSERLKAFLHSPTRRHGSVENVGLFMACLLKKL